MYPVIKVLKNHNQNTTVSPLTDTNTRHFCFGFPIMWRSQYHRYLATYLVIRGISGGTRGGWVYGRQGRYCWRYVRCGAFTNHRRRLTMPVSMGYCYERTSRLIKSWNKLKKTTTLETITNRGFTKFLCNAFSVAGLNDAQNINVKENNKNKKYLELSISISEKLR